MYKIMNSYNGSNPIKTISYYKHPQIDLTLIICYLTSQSSILTFEINFDNQTFSTNCH